MLIDGKVGVIIDGVIASPPNPPLTLDATGDGIVASRKANM